jgi:hypothetical protein
VDYELYFQWPGAPRLSPEMDDPAYERLRAAEAEVERLEADRTAALLRIEGMEAAHDRAQGVIAAQRRRLLVLERQLEDAQLMPAGDQPSRTSWLDRLLGGSATPVRT